MAKVFAFFCLMAIMYSLWKITPDNVKNLIKSVAKKHVVPAILFAAVVTIAMVAFAFFSNGKVI